MYMYTQTSHLSSTGDWKEVGKVQGDTQCGVPCLKPKHKYKFRVKAVNKEGVSEPLVTDKETLAKDPWGMTYPYEYQIRTVRTV